MEEIEEMFAPGVTLGLALGLLGFLLLLLPLAIPRLIIRRRRHFWCATGGEHGLVAGHRSLAIVFMT